MSMILILTDQSCALDTETLGRLGELGVTNVTLLEEASTRGVLIQGWAFERSSADAAVEILTSGELEVRVLQPVMQVSVSPRAVVDVRSGESWTTEMEGK